MDQGKQTDIDEQEEMMKRMKEKMQGKRKNVETDLVHDSKPIASTFSRIQNSNIPH